MSYLCYIHILIAIFPNFHSAFIGVLLMKNAAPSKNQKYPSRLAWLFGINNKLNENKDENNEENKPTICQSQECEKIGIN